MPQFNHFETRQGQIVDPTFGLNALDAETKRKTKAREQMNMATNVIRQSLSAEGKGLTADTTVEIDEGGQYTFKGASGTKDLANLYNIRNTNYGKSGYGDRSTETLNQANSKHAEYVVGQKQEDAKPRHEAAQSLLGGILSGNGLSPTKGMKSGQSSGVGLNVTDTNSMSGNDMIDVQKDVSIAVDDKVQMNESDLRVAAAMEALNAQLYGGENPGTYKALMEENSKTFQRVNEANKLESHATEQKVGPAFHIQNSMSTGGDKRDSKDFAPVTGNPKEPDKYKSYMGLEGDRNLKIKDNKDGTYSIPDGGQNKALLYDMQTLMYQSEYGTEDGSKGKATGKGDGFIDFLYRKAEKEFGRDVQDKDGKYITKGRFVDDLGNVPRNEKDFFKYLTNLPTPPDDDKIRLRVDEGRLAYFKGSKPMASYGRDRSMSEISGAGAVEFVNAGHKNKNEKAWGAKIYHGQKLKQNEVDFLVSHTGE